MPEYIEVNGKDIEKYEYILSDNDKEAGEQEPRVKIDVDEAIWSGKTKALIVLMPQYKGDIPTVINVGLEQKEIGQAIDLADGAFFTDTYKRQVKELEDELAKYRGY